MRRFLYDTSIFVYALGGEHPCREPCREIVRKATAGDLQGEASADLLQELLHQQARRTGDPAGAARTARNVAMLAWWHPLEPHDVQRGIDLFEKHADLDARDAVFAALALNRGSRPSSPQTAPSMRSRAWSGSTQPTSEPSPA